MERPRRIAEAIAGTPYRVLSVNRPYDFQQFVPGFLFDGKRITEMAAVSMLNNQAPIIYGDDVLGSVAANYQTENGTELSKMVLKMQSAPRAIPPFEQMFIDTSFTSCSAKNESDKTHVQVAAFVQTDPLQRVFSKSEKILKQLCIFYARSYFGMQMQHEKATENQIESFMREGESNQKFKDLVERFMTLKQVGIYSYITTLNKRKPYGPWALSIYLLDENYKMLQVEGCPSDCRMLCDFNIHDIIPESEIKNHPTMERDIKSITGIEMNVAIVVQTISLLNCSNVKMIQTGETNSDLSKRVRSAERYASVRHHELRVQVGTQLLRVDGRTEDGHQLNPLHSVRGHFRDYSTGKGLFGKYKYDCIWVPQYVRGSAEEGIITKDYILSQDKNS